MNSIRLHAGNHSFSHLNYADTPLEVFENDIIKGEVITREILKQKHQALTYFRFPYNSLGNDSTTHQQIRSFLTQNGYTVAPFTIESEDWMFNALYEDALKTKNVEKAHQLGQNYVAFTLLLFDYFEKLCLDRFGRNIKQIFRWEPDQKKRKALLQAEPENTILHAEYDQLTKRAGKN